MTHTLTLEETEALLYGAGFDSGIIHNQRVFQFYEPGTRLQSGIESAE